MSKETRDYVKAINTISDSISSKAAREDLKKQQSAMSSSADSTKTRG
jgi:hypothetical protein